MPRYGGYGGGRPPRYDPMDQRRTEKELAKMEGSKLDKYIGSFKGIAFLLKYYWKYGRWLMIWTLFFACVFNPARTVIQTLWSKILIDGYENGKSFGEIALLFCGVYGMLFVMWLIQRVYRITYYDKKLTELLASLNKEIYSKAMVTDYKYFDDPEFYDDYTWSVNQFAGKCTAALDVITNLCSSFMSIVALITILTTLDPLLIIFTVVLLILQTLFDLRLNKLNCDLREDNIKIDRRCDYIHRIFYLKEWSAGVKTTKVGNSFLDLYKNCVSDYKKIIDKYRGKRIAATVGSIIVECISELGLYVYATFKVFAGALSIGSLLPVVTASNSLRFYLSNFFEIFKQTQEYALYTKRIKAFLSTESEIEVQDGEALLPMPKKPYTLEFDDVSFSYANSHFGMHNLSFKIEAGQKIAIVGENGAGNTTLTKLILRLYNPSSGTIKINGEPIDKYPVRELRQTMGVAFQETPLYAMTLADNIQLYGETTRDQLTEIAHKFGIDRVLEKTGATLDTEVTREFSDDGLEMSGGERQRVALSRLFTTDFGLIVLDEPSSALDPLAEYEINKLTFENPHMATTIMISHRLSTVVDADCIYLIDNGRIVERGTHAELMAMGGKYHEMFAKQAENYVKSM